MPEILFIPSFSYGTLQRSGSFLNIPGEDVASFFYLVYRNLRSATESPGFQHSAILYEEDRQFIEQQATGPDIRELYTGDTPLEQLMLHTCQELLYRDRQIILLKQNAVGPTPGLLRRISDLLDREDELLIAGNTDTDEPILLGLNTFAEDAILAFANNSRYDKLLAAACLADAEFAVITGGYCIRGMADFSLLYSVLSKRESEVFCNQEHHEEFTRFFIDYRELL